MLERVGSIISKYTDAEAITPDSNLTADLGLTSFDVVSIVEEFEDEFGIEIEDREITGFVTIGDILRCLEERACAS